jgi:outer membrane protein assembly factor BamB
LRLQLDFDRLLKDFKSIQLRKLWSTEIEFTLTYPPLFDLKNIYLVSFNKIAVYDKNTMQNIWRKQIDNDIKSLSLMDGNNILITDINGGILALNRNTGETNWTHNFDVVYIDEFDFSSKPFQITNNDDKRLLTPIIIFPINNEINILDNNTGEILFTLDFEDYVYHVSEYDRIEQSLYVTYGDKIAKLILEKK